MMPHASSHYPRRGGVFPPCCRLQTLCIPFQCPPASGWCDFAHHSPHFHPLPGTPMTLSKVQYPFNSVHHCFSADDQIAHQGWTRPLHWEFPALHHPPSLGPQLSLVIPPRYQFSQKKPYFEVSALSLPHLGRIPSDTFLDLVELPNRPHSSHASFNPITPYFTSVRMKNKTKQKATFQCVFIIQDRRFLGPQNVRVFFPKQWWVLHQPLTMYPLIKCNVDIHYLENSVRFPQVQERAWWN